jgi:hypothetical protein
MSQTIRNVAIGRGDEIRVDIQGAGGDAGKLDYVQFDYQSETADVSAPAQSSHT